MIHYHGTPITPRPLLMQMAGKCFCVSYASRNDADICISIGQSILWDNGAFSFFTQNKPPQWKGYYKWLEPRLGHPHWAIVPDIIDGTIEEQQLLLEQWPHSKTFSAPVWHMGLSVDYLLKLVDDGWSKVCFGSSGTIWEIGSPQWERKCDEAFNALARNGPLPWTHMLRGLSLGGKRWPFASADSANVATSHHGQGHTKLEHPEYMARTIDAVQTPVHWHLRPQQEGLL